MRIAISGASGFIGSYLVRYFTSEGHWIVPLGRDFFADGPDAGETLGRRAALLRGCDAVINLAGAPINHRWTKAYKRELWESRIGTTHRLVEAINALERKPSVFISTSAVGYYDPAFCRNEFDGNRGEGFLADLCVGWEREARRVSGDVRLSIVRLGIVLDQRGGAFPRMAKPFRMGIATRIGSGHQAFAWIALQDMARVVEFIMTHETLFGVINLVAPQRTTNAGLTDALARYYGDRWRVSIPLWVFRLWYGEAAELFASGPCVIPRKLLGNGFEFRCPTLSAFLGGGEA